MLDLLCVIKMSAILPICHIAHSQIIYLFIYQSFIEGAVDLHLNAVDVSLGTVPPPKIQLAPVSSTPSHSPSTQISEVRNSSGLHHSKPKDAENMKGHRQVL